ncbi:MULTISPECIES: alkaline phosphatase family protein [Bradyrhizobium]|uniref:alkaline phosphatase family protein n=1 Tax=Bradyrhizobium TaxID=374 RepID=UPI0004140D55|nr:MULTISPECIES: alkaline phosphatase family protein [Bradyrhizobium]QOG20655.1 sulfatase-like hydrolase/transferase [Bradyrhizobium sp. SEMIA]UFW46073.1 alkaline phosphatase family protein [Bradyrhizobium arachidis]
MRRAILVVLDGLRRDFVAPETTPHLAAFAERAEQFSAYSTVFPSCTRVVSASLATGCLPARHGLQGNTMVLVEDDHLVRHDAGRPDFLQHKRRVTGCSLAVPTLAERLREHGGAVIYSNVSPGAAYAHDPDGHGRIYHRAGSFGRGRIPLPEAEQLRVTLDVAGDRAMTERFIAEAVLVRNPPALALMWLGEPDSSQHALPLGSPEHLAVVKEADRNAKRVMDAVAHLPDRDDVLFLLGSDHGHQVVGGVIHIEAELVAAGLKESLDSGDVVVASNGTSALIYLHRNAAGREAAITDFLARQDWAGAVLPKAELHRVGQSADNGLACAVAMRATEAPNRFGAVGTSFAAKRSEGKEDVIGAGQHGGLGAAEQSPFLMISGPDFSAGAVRSEASSVIDIAPTILAHLGLSASGTDGNALQRGSRG